MYVISKVPVRKSTGHEWNDESTGTIVRYIIGPIEGLANFHDIGWVHRIIDKDAILITSEDPPRQFCVIVEKPPKRHPWRHSVSIQGVKRPIYRKRCLPRISMYIDSPWCHALSFSRSPTIETPILPISRIPACWS